MLLATSNVTKCVLISYFFAISVANIYSTGEVTTVECEFVTHYWLYELVH